MKPLGKQTWVKDLGWKCRLISANTQSVLLRACRGEGGEGLRALCSHPLQPSAPLRHSSGQQFACRHTCTHWPQLPPLLLPPSLTCQEQPLKRGHQQQQAGQGRGALLLCRMSWAMACGCLQARGSLPSTAMARQDVLAVEGIGTWRHKRHWHLKMLHFCEELSF